MPLIMDVMRAHDIHVTFHLEPYRDDRVQFYAEDIRYILREDGERRRWDAFLLLEHADGSATPVFKSFRTILPPTVVDCKGRVQRVPDFAANGDWRRPVTVTEPSKPRGHGPALAGQQAWAATRVKPEHARKV